MRIAIMGNSGSGKSTYAARLVAETGAALLELDGIVWELRKIAVARPADQVLADLAGFLAAHDAWVIEGCDGDLIEAVLPARPELIFLNPGAATCAANNRRRPWEPHKYGDPADQERMLPHLLAWVESYYTRDDPRSYAWHRRVFDGYDGPKRELTGPLS
jgi:adenylate kinase family enzyme